MRAAPFVLHVERVASPLGDMLLYSTPDAVCGLEFAEIADALVSRLRSRFGRFRARAARGSEPARRLERYFRGDLSALAEVPIDPGGTAFQREVWQAMRGVPPGHCLSYGRIALALGRPGAVRAVGAASARNPIPLIIPCHRVVGADGSLVGYAGGVERKRWLLRHEACAEQLETLKGPPR